MPSSSATAGRRAECADLGSIAARASCTSRWLAREQSGRRARAPVAFLRPDTRRVSSANRTRRSRHHGVESTRTVPAGAVVGACFVELAVVCTTRRGSAPGRLVGSAAVGRAAAASSSAATSPRGRRQRDAPRSRAPCACGDIVDPGIVSATDRARVPRGRELPSARGFAPDPVSAPCHRLGAFDNANARHQPLLPRGASATGRRRNHAHAATFRVGYAARAQCPAHVVVTQADWRPSPRARGNTAALIRCTRSARSRRLLCRRGRRCLVVCRVRSARPLRASVG